MMGTQGWKPLVELPTRGAYPPETSYTNRFPQLLPRAPSVYYCCTRGRTTSLQRSHSRPIDIHSGRHTFYDRGAAAGHHCVTSSDPRPFPVGIVNCSKQIYAHPVVLAHARRCPGTPTSSESPSDLPPIAMFCSQSW